jgi:hypothetical protein
MSRRGRNFALLSGCEFSKVAMIVTLPVGCSSLAFETNHKRMSIICTCHKGINAHLVIEDLGLAGFSLRDERLVENVKDILANFLQFGLDLLTIVADCADMLVRAL